MKRRIFQFPDASQVLLTELDDGTQEVARRSTSWEGWSPPAPRVRTDDDPPDARPRQDRYLERTPDTTEAPVPPVHTPPRRGDVADNTPTLAAMLRTLADGLVDTPEASYELVRHACSVILLHLYDAPQEPGNSG